MTPTLRIAVLECDTPIGRTKERYQGYGNLFTELFTTAASRLVATDGAEPPPPKLDITKYDVVNHEVYPRLEDVDAVLLTGSKFNAFDNDPWILKLVDFTRAVLETQDRVRLIGVCFGHQIIGRALDVKVDRGVKGWEIAVTEVALTEKGKELFGLKSLAIHQMHRDIVYTLPSAIPSSSADASPTPVEALGHTSICEVQGMHARKRLISVQGHPEFTGDIVSELLDVRHEAGVFNDGMYEEAMGRVQRKHDGVQVAVGFLRFLLDGREA